MLNLDENEGANVQCERSIRGVQMNNTIHPSKIIGDCNDNRMIQVPCTTIPRNNIFFITFDTGSTNIIDNDFPVNTHICWYEYNKSEYLAQDQVNPHLSEEDLRELSIISKICWSILKNKRAQASERYDYASNKHAMWNEFLGWVHRV